MFWRRDGLGVGFIFMEMERKAFRQEKFGHKTRPYVSRFFSFFLNSKNLERKF